MVTKIIALIKDNIHYRMLTISVFIFIFVLCSSLIVKQISRIVLVSFSVLVILCLFNILLNIYNKYISKFERKLFLIIVSVVSIITLVGYIYIVYSRNFTYFDDHVVYYNQQNELRNVFSISPAKGFFAILSSCWFSDYSYFINIVLDFPFFFTSGSNDAYVICYVVFMIIPTYFAGNIFIFNFSREFAYKKRLLFVLLSNLLFVTFPLFHIASILGMPDVFGLFFVFLIMTELSNYNYNLYSFKNTLLISILIILLIITRRWYLFWALGFVASILLIKMLFAINKSNDGQKKEIFINNIKTIVSIGLVVTIPLIPFIYKTLFVRNYTVEYSAWYLGGFPYELYNQLGYIGILLSLVLLFGMIYGLINDKLRVLTIASILGFLISVFAFTRIQNMGKHQSLCLMGYYLVFLYNAIYFISKLKNKILKSLCSGIIIIIMLLNMVSTFTGYHDDLDGVFPTTKYSIATRFTWK